LVRNRITNLVGQFKGYNLTATNNNYGEAMGGSFQSAYITELKPGYPAGVFNLPRHGGFDAQGNELFIIRTEDGKDTTSTSFSEDDKIYIDPTPAFEWSITNTFTYRNFDLSIYVRGVQGGKVFANSLLNLESTAYLPGVNVSTEAFNNGFVNKPNISTYWLQDASFARLENVALGYTLNRLKGLRRLRVYVVGKNLLLLTKYRGLDPEVNVEGTQRYIDQSYYPKSRSITVGLDISF
jgi:iron complex outermembrane receptor protein